MNETNKTSGSEKFNLSTTTMGGAVSASCDLNFTVKEVLAHRPAQIPALRAAIQAELVKATAKLAEAEKQIAGQKRGTRSGRSAGAKYDRASNRVNCLENALSKLA